jgi:hypothetical protein
MVRDDGGVAVAVGNAVPKLKVGFRVQALGVEVWELGFRATPFPSSRRGNAFRATDLQ